MSSESLRVLCVLPDLTGGGAQRTMINLVNAFPEAGVQPTLAVAGPSGAAVDWIADPSRVVMLGNGRVRSALRPLRREILRRRPDLIFSTMVDANILAALASVGGRSAPLIVRETNSHRARDDLGWLRRRLVRWAYRRAARVVALSHGVGKELIEDYSLQPDRVVTIHNPVKLSAFRSAAARRGAPGRSILAAGRLTRQKGFDLLIAAFANLSHADAHLVIIGDGPDKADLEAEARRRGVADRVTFPGFVADPADWMARADLFVLSSRWEGFGHVIVEAMAAGTPVVAVDCPHGPRDIIESEKTGILVPPGAGIEARLAAAIDTLFADPDKARRMAGEASAAADKFDVGSIVDAYAGLFADVSAAAARR